MTVHEPMTVVTDYLLGGCLLFWALSLWREGRERSQTSVRLWAGAFLFSALAALAGGTFHALGVPLFATSGLVLWKLTVYSVGLAAFFLLAAVFVAVFSPPWNRWLTLAALLQLAGYAAWMFRHNDFHYVVYDYAAALVAVLVLQVGAWMRWRAAAAPWILAGVAGSFLAAGVQAAGIAPHPEFDHNALYHVIQIGAFYLFFRGGRRLTDR